MYTQREADQVTLNPEPPPIFAGNRASQAPGVCRPRLGGATSDRASGSRRFRRGRVHSLRGAVQDANSLLTRLSVQKPGSRCPICYAGEEVDHRSLLCGSDSGNAGGKAAAKNASRGKRAPVWHFDADLEPTIGQPVPTRFGTAAGMFNIGPLTSRHESREEWLSRPSFRDLPRSRHQELYLESELDPQHDLRYIPKPLHSSLKVFWKVWYLPKP